MEAIEQDGSTRRYASQEADNEVMVEAVKQCGAHECASEELEAGEVVVMKAVKQYSIAHQCVLEELKADKEVATEAVKQ